MVENAAIITGFGQVFPHTYQQEDMWNDFFTRHYDNSAIARRLFSVAGVASRHVVANPTIDDVSEWSTGERMRRYVAEAVPLAKHAITRALVDASLAPNDISMFATVSCTGYATPGVDVLIARDLKMSDDTQRLFIGHMGCYAALPGLATVRDYVALHQKPALLLCVELTSLHIQPPTNDVEQMVAHALFSDAASAVVVEPQQYATAKRGFEVVDFVVKTDIERAELMSWTVTDLGFRMGLSQRVPDVLAEHVRPVVDKLLGRNNITIEDVDAWAAHPGGPRILDVIGEQLELKPDDLAESRAVLSEHGNCSSATVLIVLNALRERGNLQPGNNVVAMAFGPGLTLYAALLRAV